jgi:hypothetical protein
MLNDSEEQKAGRTDNGRSEEDVQQDERQP